MGPVPQVATWGLFQKRAEPPVEAYCHSLFGANPKPGQVRW